MMLGGPPGMIPPPGMMPPPGLGMPGFPFGGPGMGGDSTGISDLDKGKNRRFSENDQVSGRGGPSRDEPAAIKGVDDDDANSDALSAASGSEAGDNEDINAD